MTTNTEKSDQNIEIVKNEPKIVLTIADVVGVEYSPKSRQTCCGWARTWRSFSLKEKIYLISAIFSLLFSIGLTIERLFVLNTDSDDFTFALLLLWTTIFCTTYVLHGMLTESSYELMALVLTTIIVLIYVILNFASTEKTTMKIIRLVVTVVISPGLIFYGCLLSREYNVKGKLLFNTAGANQKTQSMFKIYFLCSNLLVFDMQLCGSSIILWLQDGLTKWTTEEIVTVSIGSILTLVWLTTGLLGKRMGYDFSRFVKSIKLSELPKTSTSVQIRMENKWLIYLCYSLSPFQIIIIIWNLVRNSKSSEYSAQLTISVWMSGVITIIIRLLSLVFLHLVKNNFNKGIKDKLYGK